jgi:hypothetical protein
MNFFKIILSVGFTLLAIFISLIVFVNLYNWNHARPYIQKFSKEYLHQEIRINGDLSIRLTTRFDLEVNEFTIDSPENVSEKPLVQLDRLNISLNVFPIIFGDLVFEQIDASKGMVNLIQPKDGVSNWMFKPLDEANKNPPPKDKETTDWPSLLVYNSTISDLKVSYNESVSLTVDRLSAEFINNSIAFDFNGDYNSLPTKLKGRFYQVNKYLADTGALEPELDVQLDQIRGRISGSIKSEPHKDEAKLSLHVEADGEGLSEVLSKIGWVPNGDIAPFEIKTHITSKEESFALNDIDLTLGQSTAQGSVVFELKSPTVLVVDTDSTILHFDDLGPFFPKSEAGKIPAESVKQPNKNSKEEGASGKIFSDEPLAPAAFSSLELDIKARVNSFVGSGKSKSIRSFVLNLSGKNGVLKLDPLRLGFETGNIQNYFVYDSRNALENSAAARVIKLDASFSRVSLDALVKPYLEGLGIEKKKIGTLEPQKMMKGDLYGDVKLITHGVSMAQVMAKLDGNINLAVHEGQMNSLLIEALGLDLTESIAAYFSENALIPMPCMLLGVDVDEGVARTRTFLISTQDSNVLTDATLNLGKETIDAQINTLAKDFSLGAFSAPITLNGPLSSPNIGLGTKETLGRIGLGALLGAAVTPAASLAALVEPGSEEDTNRCQTYAKTIKGLNLKSIPSH